MTAKYSYNKFHHMWEIYYYKQGKQHVGYYSTIYSAATAVRVVNKMLELM